MNNMDSYYDKRISERYLVVRASGYRCRDLDEECEFETLEEAVSYIKINHLPFMMDDGVAVFDRHEQQYVKMYGKRKAFMEENKRLKGE